METKYIADPEECSKTADEFMAEFVENVYPAYKKYGLTIAEAISIWKLNSIYNVLCDLTYPQKEEWES